MQNSFSYISGWDIQYDKYLAKCRNSMRLLHLKLSNCNSSTVNTTAAFLAHYNILHICPQLEWQKQPALELTSREKVWPVGYKSRSCPAGNAAPIFNHKPSVFQLGRMGRPQLAHRKVAEANIEITNKMSLPPTHMLTHWNWRGRKKHSSACLERVQVGGRKSDLCFQHRQCTS